MSLSNYPPGVTGNEQEIAGYPPCTRCGHDFEEHTDDGVPLSECCGAPAIEDTDFCAKCRDASGFWACYPECTCGEYDQYPPDPDPDRKHDEEKERKVFGE